MRVLGVDLGIGSGSKPDNIAICIIDNRSGKNKLISLNVAETKANISEMSAVIYEIFKDSNCDFIAINTTGVACAVYNELQKMLEDKVKPVRCYMESNHKMLMMLQKDNTLSRVGLGFKTNVRNGLLTLNIDSCEDFEVSMIYAIGLANMVINEEGIKISREKEEVIQKRDCAKRTIEELTKRLEELELN